MAFWNKNKHDICPNEKELDSFVTNYLGGNSRIKINSKLTVPEGYFCVLGRRGKVADKFDTGEHFLNFASMPYMCRRFGVDKVKDGKQQEKISCQCYFISKQLQPGQFKTYRKVEMGTRAYGIYKAHVYGMYSFKVTNPQELMQSLLNEYDYIKTGEAQNIISAWVNDLIVCTLEKNNFVISDVVANSPIIAESLKQAINKLFESAGLELGELKIYKYKLPKQYQQESDKVIAKQLGQEQAIEKAESLENIEPNEQDLQNGVDNSKNETFEQKLENTENAQINQNQTITLQNNIDEKANIDYNQTANQINEQYVPFGNFVINNGSIENLQKIVEKDTTNEQKPKFVDLNLDNLYSDKKQDTKRCLNCGAENNKNAQHCLLCGEKFLEGDF